MSSTKPFVIAKRAVWEAYQQVKANRGAAGIDEETIAMFEQDLSKNLYKLWNRISSGSYFPPPVKQVEIPKAKGGTRKLGIPTVSDRIAQTVVKRIIEPVLDPIFHPDSYGYRPGRSAKQAIGVTRKRCWQYDWVVEFDIKAAFDQIDHGLLLKAVRSHVKERWILLYLERWLTAPFETPGGEQVLRQRGTPQGGVISPLLMNLFMHYAFDLWMQRNYPQCQFCRYADDAVVHCGSQKQAREVMQAIASRLSECGLTMHPEKSKIVYCKDSNRTQPYPQIAPDIYQLPAGRKHRCHEEDASGSARVEAESSDSCGDCCVGQAIQPDHLRVVELLRGVLSDSNARPLYAHRPCARTMGQTQVQDPIGTTASRSAVVVQDEGY
jgi:group II intron reverse transcriptase/maturase